MTTTVLGCSKCGAPVRFREGEAEVQCSVCGAMVALEALRPLEVVEAVLRRRATVSRRGNGRLRDRLLRASLVALAVVLFSLALLRQRTSARQTRGRPRAAAPVPIYSAPALPPVTPTPEGEIAWEPNARAPILTSVDADGIEDIVGFFRVWDGGSAWVAHAGVFSGKTLALLWQSEPIDPQLVKLDGVLPLAIVAGDKLVVADTSATLRVYNLASGEKLETLKLAGPVRSLCHSKTQPARIWAEVTTGEDTAMDLGTGTTELARRPRWCPASPNERHDPSAIATRVRPGSLVSPAEAKAPVGPCATLFANAVMAQASCFAPVKPALDPAFTPVYVLADGARTVALGTKAKRPFAQSLSTADPWSHSFVTAETQVKDAAPAVTELTLGRLYAVYEKVYLDARLAAVDAGSGETLWDVPLVGSLSDGLDTGLGEARALVATDARVYVVRAGGGLDVIDAASGAALGTIGKR